MLSRPLCKIASQRTIPRKHAGFANSCFRGEFARFQRLANHPRKHGTRAMRLPVTRLNTVMITFRTSLVLVGLLAVGLSAAPIAGSKDQPIVVEDNPKASTAPAKEDKPKGSAEKKHRGTFTISKETTYFTGPLDKDGY